MLQVSYSCRTQNNDFGYATAYDIRINRAVENDNIIDGILAAGVSYLVSIHQENV